MTGTHRLTISGWGREVIVVEYTRTLEDAGYGQRLMIEARVSCTLWGCAVSAVVLCWMCHPPWPAVCAMGRRSRCLQRTGRCRKGR